MSSLSSFSETYLIRKSLPKSTNQNFRCSIKFAPCSCVRSLRYPIRTRSIWMRMRFIRPGEKKKRKIWPKSIFPQKVVFFLADPIPCMKSRNVPFKTTIFQHSTSSSKVRSKKCIFIFFKSFTKFQSS